MQGTIKDFCEKYSKVYIFEKGKEAGFITELLNYFDIETDGYICLEGSKKKTRENRVVYYPSELEVSEDTGVIIGCSEDSYDEVMETVVKMGIKHICFPTEWVQFGKTMKYLKALGVDIKSEVLDMKKFKTANLLPYIMKDKRAIITYVLEFPDLGYHYLGADSTYFDEGPYEFEDVIFDIDKCQMKQEAIDNVRLHNGDVVFDCGANIGMFSSAAAGKGCTTYAFEPVPAQIEYLKMNQEIYPDKIIIVPKAIADYNGTAQFNICPGYNGGDSLITSFDKQKETIDVDVTTLDRFVEENGITRVDFIKADLEAAERLLLKGAKKVLNEFQPVLSLCTYHRPDDVYVLTDLIKEINPKYNISYGWKKIYAWVDKSEKN